MDAMLRVCANCRVLVEPSATGWRHVPEYAAKFDREVCEQPAEGRNPSGSEIRFGLARVKTPGGDKLTLKGRLEQLSLPPGMPITVGVDGSYKLTVGDKVIKPMSWAYLATDGTWGLGTSVVPGSIVGSNRALQAELRAIANALRALDADRPITVLSDSQDALGFLTLWRDGHDVMPGGYNVERSGGRQSTLSRLARLVREDQGRITWSWIRGHAGHPLNEGSDRLARIARAWADGRLTREQVLQRTPDVVLGALSRHADSCPV